MNASEKISANDLDFRVNYEGRDEMGEICRAFEQMRGQLEVNFRALWRSVEERNRLNAVFAHDLRTPLSVLKGYLEMVSAYWPQRRMSEEKLLDTIRTMENHVERLERYVDAMNSIPKLEDRPVNRIAIESDALIASLTETVRRIAERRNVSVNSHSAADATVLSVDMDLVTQAVENVAANAVRFAVRQIRVDIRVADGTLSVAVADDGPGFSPEELSQAASPFYRGVASASNEHQGLGLYICQALCEKHGGRLRLRNGARGGGEVVAVFDCR